MRQKKILKLIGVSLVTVGLLAGCGGGGNTPTDNIVAKNINGSLLKGAITNAKIKIYDANTKEVASGTSKDGKFSVPDIELTSKYYIIKSLGGSYLDEATKKMVTVPVNMGLKSILTKVELQSMIDAKEFSALTPESTIFTNLVEFKIAKGKSLSDAMSEAKTLISNLLIKGSSPMPGLAGDEFNKKGDLTKAIPKDKSEAFAKNRAIAFSYLAKNLGVEPSKIFEILGKISEDLKDGKEDGIDIDGDGTVDANAVAEYVRARNELFEETTTKLYNGQLSKEQIAELKLMGFDVDKIKKSQADKASALNAEVSKYLNSSTLPTLHILPTIVDEDANLTDTKETYTLTANKDVNVTIQTPMGSWITPMWRYNNNPLPVVIRANRGDDMTLRLNNQLDAASTIHWHGFKIPAIMDGGPDMPVAPNSIKSYTFTMNQPASPLWFHPHPDMQTGKQVYMGLAGIFLLEDSISKQLEANNELPSGNRDVVLAVQDRRFAKEKNGVRELVYKNMPMDSDGMLGDKVLVNGSVIPKLGVDTAQYRFRLYNVSNARTYDFAFNDGRKFKIVATDGGLLKEPVEVEHIKLGAAERVELVVDFSKDSIGKKVMLVSKPFKGDMMGMMGGMNMENNSGSSGNAGMNKMRGGNSGGGMSGMARNSGMNMGDMNSMQMPKTGEGLAIMRFDVTNMVSDSVTLYSQLPQDAEINSRIDPAGAVNKNHPRQFVMSMKMGKMGGMKTMDANGSGVQNGGMDMSFVINGKSFDMNRVDEQIASGATEIWEIKNASPMAHPFHAHAVQYQILERNGKAATGTDLGWKDTFLVEPGGNVKIIAKFDPIINKGDYMYHCHILEHEDAGMMGYFRVGPTGHVGNK